MFVVTVYYFDGSERKGVLLLAELLTNIKGYITDATVKSVAVHKMEQ